MSRLPVPAAPFSVRLGGPHPTRFGIGRRWLLAAARSLPETSGEDARLFARTFVAGFVAVSLFLA